MKMKPFWGYFGGKYRSSIHYPKPLYNTIIEPFAGAAGYSLRNYEKNIILIEKYDVICEIWRYLIKVKSSEIMDIPLVQHVDDLPKWVPQGGKWLVGFHMNAGTVSPSKQLSSGIKKLWETGRKYQGWSESMRERIASQVNYIRHWKIIQGEYSCIKNITSTWFVDPPYQKTGKYYKHSKINYNKLSHWCKERNGQIIVCEGQNADWLPFQPFKTIKAGVGGNGVHRKFNEVIWYNENEYK